MCVSVWAVCTQVQPSAITRDNVGAHRAGITSSCEPPNMDTGKQTPVLYWRVVGIPNG